MLTVAGTGTGMTPCWHRTVPRPSMSTGTIAPSMSKQIDENRRGHDIHDRIDRPDLVEVHLLDRQTVGLGLSLGEDAKSAAGECGGPRSERSGLDDGEDIGEVAMGMVVGAVSRMIMMASMVVSMAGMVVMALMVMAVAMVVAAPALPAVDVTMVALARMLVPMQVRHVVVVVLMRLVQHHIEVQARNARLGHAAHPHGESLDGRLPSMSRTARSAASESSAASIKAATSISPATPAWQSSHNVRPRPAALPAVPSADEGIPFSFTM